MVLRSLKLTFAIFYYSLIALEINSWIHHRCKLSYFHKNCIFIISVVLPHTSGPALSFIFFQIFFSNEATLGYNRKVLQFHVFPLFNNTHKEISCCKVCFKIALCWNRTTFQDETRAKVFLRAVFKFTIDLRSIRIQNSQNSNFKAAVKKVIKKSCKVMFEDDTFTTLPGSPTLGV